MKTIAVVGCGRIAKNAHFPALNQIEDVRIKYACDLLIEKAQQFKEEYPKVENVITDYKVALADPEVDVVYVLTPNFAHYTVTMDALRAGKHVFCEKPITVSYELSKEMQALANEKGLMLNIGVCNRYHRSVEMLKDYVECGKFGKLYHIYCRVAETATTFASPISEYTEVITDKSYPTDIPEKPVVIAKNSYSITLLAVPGVEFSLDGV
jgi:predicted dehydrogenase